MSLAEDLLNLLLKKDKPKTTAPKPVVAEPQGMGQKATPPASPMQNVAATVVPTLSQLPVQSASMGLSIPSMRQDPELEEQTIGARKELTAKLLEQLKSQEAAKDLQGFITKSRLQAFTPQLDVTPGLAFLDAQLGTNVAKATPQPKSLEEALTEQAQLQGQVAQQERGLTDNVREALATFQNDQAARDSVRLAIAQANQQNSLRNMETRVLLSAKGDASKLLPKFNELRQISSVLMDAIRQGDVASLNRVKAFVARLSGEKGQLAEGDVARTAFRDFNTRLAELEAFFSTGQVPSPEIKRQFQQAAEQLITANAMALEQQAQELSGLYGVGSLQLGQPVTNILSQQASQLREEMQKKVSPQADQQNTQDIAKRIQEELRSRRSGGR